MLLLSGKAFAQNFAGDMALSKVLIEGENWQRVASGFSNADAATSDADGNFYFAATRSGRRSIFQLDPEGQLTSFIAAAPGVSGLQFGPDGKLYGTRWGKNDVVVFDAHGNLTTLVTDSHPNDLVITSQGLIFYTTTEGVRFLDSARRSTLVATGLASANGITLSAKQGTLVVSEHQGRHAWAFRIEPNGLLRYGEPYMTLRLPFEKDVSLGDGATTDIAGRYYITSALGIQMFDATGRISGVLLKPSQANPSNCTFAGEGHRYLYVTAGGEVYRRLTKTRGVLFFQDFRQP